VCDQHVYLMAYRQEHFAVGRGEHELCDVDTNADTGNDGYVICCWVSTT